MAWRRVTRSVSFLGERVCRQDRPWYRQSALCAEAGSGAGLEPSSPRTPITKGSSPLRSSCTLDPGGGLTRRPLGGVERLAPSWEIPANETGAKASGRRSSGGFNRDPLSDMLTALLISSLAAAGRVDEMASTQRKSRRERDGFHTNERDRTTSIARCGRARRLF